MFGAATAQPQFLARTTLLPGEYRANFRQIDRDAIRLVRSRAAREVTKLMAHVYLCLVDAPRHLHEREGVLRFAGENRDGQNITAWQQLIELLEVADGTAHKALQWMAEQKLIGYHAGKNGVGIRIFLNRAAASIKREGDARAQKNLRLAGMANGEAGVSPIATPFQNNARELEDQKINPHAPKNGAERIDIAKVNAEEARQAPSVPSPPTATRRSLPLRDDEQQRQGSVALEEIVTRLRRELEPCVRSAATQAAQQAAAGEVERTRQWFEQRALPKAVRIAQHETYDLLRKQNSLDERARRTRVDLQVGRSVAISECQSTVARTLAPAEIKELAETCLALLEVQGKSIEATLAETSAESGGWLQANDAVRVRQAVQALMLAKQQESFG